MRYLTLLLVGAFCALFIGCAPQTPQEPPPPPPGVPTGPPTTGETPEEPVEETTDTDAGDEIDTVQSDIEALLAQAQGEATEDLDAAVGEIILPDAEAWFATTFGEEAGQELADAYASRTEDPQDLSGELRDLAEDGFTDVIVTLLTTDMTGVPTNLYLVELGHAEATTEGVEEPTTDMMRDPTDTRELGIFAVVDGVTRFVGTVGEVEDATGADFEAGTPGEVDTTETTETTPGTLDTEAPADDSAGPTDR